MVLWLFYLFAYTPTNTTDRGCKIQLLTLRSAITQRIPPLSIRPNVLHQNDVNVFTTAPPKDGTGKRQIQIKLKQRRLAFSENRCKVKAS